MLCALVFASLSGPAGCSRDSSQPPDSGPAAPSERMTAPLKIVLRGPTPPPAEGDFKLNIDIVAAEPIQQPLQLRIEVPAGAKLTAGNATESLTISQPGTITREISLHLDGPLAAPIVVTGETRDSSGRAGLKAVRKYPPDAPTISSAAPRPPVPRPPAP